jgi:hypothetical protein
LKGTRQSLLHIIQLLITVGAVSVPDNAVAKFFDTQGKQSQWPPVTEIKKLKKSQYLLCVFVIPNVLSAEKYFFFHLRYSLCHLFCHSLYSAACGGRTTRTTVVSIQATDVINRDFTTENFHMFKTFEMLAVVFVYTR